MSYPIIYLITISSSTALTKIYQKKFSSYQEAKVSTDLSSEIHIQPETTLKYENLCDTFGTYLNISSTNKNLIL